MLPTFSSPLHVRLLRLWWRRHRPALTRSGCFVGYAGPWAVGGSGGRLRWAYRL